MTSGLTLLYLRSCASGTDVIGQLSRTPCSPSSMVPHLRRQQGGMEVMLWGTVVTCRETLQQKAKWTRSFIAHHDSWTRWCSELHPGYRWGGPGREAALSQQPHPSAGISRVKPSDQPGLRTPEGHSICFHDNPIKRVMGLKISPLFFCSLKNCSFNTRIHLQRAWCMRPLKHVFFFFPEGTACG